MRRIMKISFTTALSLAATLQTGAAFAAGAKDAAEFHELLRSSVPADMSSAEKMPLVHMLPDQNILQAADAETLEQAMEAVKGTSLVNLIQNTMKLEKSARPLNADEALAKHPLTIVIVPGFLGEFIPNRGFEEVLAQPSAERDEFIAKVNQATAVGDADATERRFSTNNLDKLENVKLSDVVHVGSIKGKNGKSLARVVLFFTPGMSLESIGDLKNHAAVFNRRLAKYLALTGPQDLAFVGYSRGTPLGLEMLAQAKEQNLSWLPSVKAMISLGGVTSGSSLADMYENPNKDAKHMLDALRDLRNDLDPYNVIFTTWAWTKFMARAIVLRKGLSAHAEMPDEKYQSSLLDPSVDAGAVLNLVMQVGGGLGLDQPVGQFYFNVRRFQEFVGAMIEGISGLTTRARLDWWKTHALPKSVHYYTITAAQANPNNGGIEEQIFNTPIGYNLTADDKSLLQNSLDYKSESGIALNDSQVAIAQAMILPNAVAKLNPANAGLTSSFLGTCGTHHWGLALREVAKMNDGRANPFPREALLKSLAAKVALDLER